MVTGGRDYRDKERLYRVLDAFRHEFDVLRHGGARGADTLAHTWAQDRGVQTDRMPAEWKRLGRAAGPIRNQEMIDKAPRPILCIAFPGGDGTAHMCWRIKQAGITLVQLER